MSRGYNETMDTDTIRTPADYAAALAEIDRMGDPEIGTADFERLDSLVTQAEEYEDEHFPMGTPTAEAVAEYEAEKRGQKFYADGVDAPADGLCAGAVASDSERGIDFSDIPATSEADWVGAVRGKFHRPTQDC